MWSNTAQLQKYNLTKQNFKHKLLYMKLDNKTLQIEFEYKKTTCVSGLISGLREDDDLEADWTSCKFENPHNPSNPKNLHKTKKVHLIKLENLLTFEDIVILLNIGSGHAKSGPVKSWQRLQRHLPPPPLLAHNWSLMSVNCDDMTWRDVWRGWWWWLLIALTYLIFTAGSVTKWKLVTFVSWIIWEVFFRNVQRLWCHVCVNIEKLNSTKKDHMPIIYVMSFMPLMPSLPFVQCLSYSQAMPLF